MVQLMPKPPITRSLVCMKPFHFERFMSKRSILILNIRKCDFRLTGCRFLYDTRRSVAPIQVVGNCYRLDRSQGLCDPKKSGGPVKARRFDTGRGRSGTLCVEVHREFVWMRPQASLAHLAGHLVVNPRLDQVFGE